MMKPTTQNPAPFPSPQVGGPSEAPINAVLRGKPLAPPPAPAMQDPNGIAPERGPAELGRAPYQPIRLSTGSAGAARKR